MLINDGIEGKEILFSPALRWPERNGIKGIFTDAIKFMGSNQEIQIKEDGSVHIVH